MPILHPYQRTGVKFLVENTGKKGALLADGCGTGKTAQVCVALSELFDAHSTRYFPTVIIAPSSTIYHWKAELSKWGFKGRFEVVHASNKDPEYDVMDLGVLITTARGWTDAAFWHDPRNLRGLVIDEASCLKNPKAQLVKTVHSCADFLQIRWALSATPAQNTLMELKQVFDFVQPGLLGDDTSFADEISDQVRRGTRSIATPPEVAAATSRAKILYLLGSARKRHKPKRAGRGNPDPKAQFERKSILWNGCCFGARDTKRCTLVIKRPPSTFITQPIPAPQAIVCTRTHLMDR